MLAVVVSLLIVAPDTIPVKEEPSPRYLVALKVPVDGTKLNLVDDVLAGKLPVVVVTERAGPPLILYRKVNGAVPPVPINVTRVCC